MPGYQRKKRRMTAEINVVPYIDVMLVLLIIFMVTSPFVTQGVDVNLPQASTAKTAQELMGDDNASFVIVEVDKEGQLGVSIDNDDFERNLSIDEVISRVQAERELNPNSPVAVGGDKATSYENIVLVLDQLSRAGIAKVGLLTDFNNDN
ncbi:MULTISPECIES: protein TolR [unclassified Vibrio]|uniref:Tol-Pal system protein TolR n=1 Tax=Vibrio sp. HB236076 TaxID=3232307 RepID=A0AB39HIA1_9VIBR|nr:protein TolR [Vibrio sp. HB161653]MDP5255035.1 protein TolR [Vibrio sp. HB161653]